MHQPRNRRRPASHRPLRARDNVLTRVTARREAEHARRDGECLVFTNGCFDLLHVGHIRSLEEARGLGDRLIVGLNSDASVRRLKGRGRPAIPARQRAEILAALACVDWVVVFGQDTPLSLIRALRPHVLAKGGDWSIDEIVGREDVQSWGGRAVRLREIPGVRTTSLLGILTSSGTRRR